MADRELGFMLHFYQPGRETFLKTQAKNLSVGPEWNEIIYEQVYSKILAGDLPKEGFLFSCYPTLRKWMEKYHPWDFAKVRRNVGRLPGGEDKFLGDPAIHSILPLSPPDDLPMLLDIGRRAIKKDFGFYPNGLWLPETAVSGEEDGGLLSRIRRAGYLFIALRSDQLENTESNPMWVKTSAGDLAVVHFDRDLNLKISFDPWVTVNADDFLDNFCKMPITILGSDGEFYGHHQKDRDKFWRRASDPKVLAAHGLKPFDIRAALDRRRKYTRVKSGTSWSCSHHFGRWTGDEACNCDNPSFERRREKRRHYEGLRDTNLELNRLLGPGRYWRPAFTEAFVEAMGQVFTGENFIPKFFRHLGGFTKREKWLMVAKVYNIIVPSCAWFFGKDDCIEKQISEGCLTEVNNLLARWGA